MLQKKRNEELKKDYESSSDYSRPIYVCSVHKENFFFSYFFIEFFSLFLFTHLFVYKYDCCYNF